MPDKTHVKAACYLPAALVLGLLLIGCAPSQNSLYAPIDASAQAEIETAVRQVMAEQVDAWNTGDVEGFMQGYWKSDSLRFASGGNVRYGWQETLEGYQRGYPDQAAMGTLSFTDLDVDVLSPRHALVFGRWRLDRADDTPNGLFTLLFERQPGGAWRIVHDHTSSAAAAAE